MGSCARCAHPSLHSKPAVVFVVFPTILCVTVIVCPTYTCEWIYNGIEHFSPLLDWNGSLLLLDVISSKSNLSRYRYITYYIFHCPCKFIWTESDTLIPKFIHKYIHLICKYTNDITYFPPFLIRLVFRMALVGLSVLKRANSTIRPCELSSIQFFVRSVIFIELLRLPGRLRCASK